MVLRWQLRMIGANVSNLIACSLENWCKRPQAWWTLGGNAHRNVVVLGKFPFILMLIFIRLKLDKTNNLANVRF